MNRSKLLPMIICTGFFLSCLAGCGVPETSPEETLTDPPNSPPSTSIPASTSTTIPARTPPPSVEHTLSVRNISIIYDDDGSRDGTVALLYLLSEPDYFGQVGGVRLSIAVNPGDCIHCITPS